MDSKKARTGSSVTHADRAMSRPGAAGFTLVELMVVVTILAVLSIVAITSYKYYMRRAYGQEARGLLLDMKMKQEQYFATWSQYVTWPGTTVDPGATWPTTSELSPSDNTLYKWNSLNCTNATVGSKQEALCHLSFRPAGNESHWRVATWGWTPAFSGSVNGSDSFFNQVVAPLDLTQRWYVAIAVRDADGDGTMAKFAVHSQATAIWSENETE